MRLALTKRNIRGASADEEGVGGQAASAIISGLNLTVHVMSDHRSVGQSDNAITFSSSSRHACQCLRRRENLCYLKWHLRESTFGRPCSVFRRTMSFSEQLFLGSSCCFVARLLPRPEKALLRPRVPFAFSLLLLNTQQGV